MFFGAEISTWKETMARKSNQFTLYIANDHVEDFDKLLEVLGEKGKSFSGEIKPAIEALIAEHLKGESNDLPTV